MHIKKQKLMTKFFYTRYKFSYIDRYLINRLIISKIKGATLKNIFLHVDGDLQLKTPFESFFQFLNPANASTHRSMLCLVYVPIKPFQNCRILFSISPKSRSIALLGQKDITVCRSKPTLSRAHGYQVPPSMNTLGNFPLQA